MDEVEEQRRDEKQRQERRDRENEERAQRHQEEQEQVAAFLREHGPSTVKEIAEGTGLSAFAAEHGAKAVGKRGKDQRFATH
jgi:predicted HTH transcriptional regulator